MVQLFHKKKMRRYASGERPRAYIGDRLYEVVELSEDEIVLRTDDLGFLLNQSVFMLIKFTSGAAVTIEGVVRRMTVDRIAIELTTALPAERLCSELGIPLLKARPSHDRRREVRVLYPRGHGPNALIAGGTYPVIDISEHAFVFTSRELNFMLRQPVVALLYFHMGEKIQVKGSIYRMTADKIVVTLTEGIPPEIIYREYRLMQKET